MSVEHIEMGRTGGSFNPIFLKYARKDRMDREQFALRAQALAADVLIAVVAMLTVGFVVGVHWGEQVALVAAVITGAGYSIIEMFSGASPGKMCVNLKISGVYSYQARIATLMA